MPTISDYIVNLLDLLKSVGETRETEFGSGSKDLWHVSYHLCIEVYESLNQMRASQSLESIEETIDSLCYTLSDSQIKTLRNLHENLDGWSFEKKVAKAQPNNAGMVFSEGPTEWPAPEQLLFF